MSALSPTLLERGQRGAALAQLAALVGRGVPLDLGLAAVSESLPAKARPQLGVAVARAREGEGVGQVLERAGLIDERDRAVVAAATGAEVARTLALLADELLARESAARSLRLVLARPAWKLALLAVFATVVALGQTLPSSYAAPGGFRTLLFGSDALWSSDDETPRMVLTSLSPVVRALVDAASALAGLGVVVLGIRAIARARAGRWFLERLGRRLPVAATFVDLDTRGTFLRALGTALGSGLSLEKALERGQGALGRRYAATEVARALALAKEGAPIEACLRRVGFLDETTDWLVTAAASRPDLPREILALARTCETRLLEEVGRWGPLLGNLPELAVGGGLLAVAVRSFGFVRGLL